METLFGNFQRLYYTDESNGWSSFQIEVDPALSKAADLSKCEKEGERTTARVLGNLPFQAANFPVMVSGSWISDKYGAAFQAEQIRDTYISTDNTIAYIRSIYPDLSRKEASMIAKAVGGDLFAVINREDVEQMITRKSRVDVVTVSEIVKTARMQKDELDLLNYITVHDGNMEFVRRIMKAFPENPFQHLVTEPYKVADKAGIRFEVADSIALEEGIEPMADERVRALVLRAVHQSQKQGDTCVSAASVRKSVNRYSKKSPIGSVAISSALATEPNIIIDEEYEDSYYEKWLRNDEVVTATHIKRLNDSRIEIPYHEEYIGMIEEEMHVHYGRQQRDAFKLLKTSGIKILTGGPGTGKTTTINGLLRYCEMSKANVQQIDLSSMALSAPSGRASQRMAEATHRQASTCHRMIEYTPFETGEYFKDLNNPIAADVIVVDEVSMLDISLAAKLLGACKSGSVVLFVGDINQLQSVGPGSVLQDMIESGCIDVVQLTDVYRQKGGSPIPVNAAKIMAGECDFEEADDFRVYQVDAGEATEKAAEIAMELLAKYQDPEMIQALSPVKKGTGGIYALNDILQPILNPVSRDEKAKKVMIRKKPFFCNDRIITLSNNYEKGYFNGDVGHVENLDQKHLDISLAEANISIGRDKFSDVELAYCCTVHKSQGSEYPHTIIVLPADHLFALDQSILYTAVTRAKKGVYIIAEGEALKKAVETSRKGTRVGHLKERIQKLLEEK